MPVTFTPRPGLSFLNILGEARDIVRDPMGMVPEEVALAVRPKQSIALPAVGVSDSPGLDPRLQKLVAVRQSGGTTLATASSAPGEVAVLARVTDPLEWEALSEVRPGVVIPPAPGDEGTIVTGRIPLSRIEAVRVQPFVLSLKAAQDLRPALRSGLVETLGTPDALPPSVANRAGTGVVVGIVDIGCDFAHQNFRGGGGSRIEALWHQGGVTSANAPFGYGTLYEKQALDAALLQANPYTSLGYGPRPDTPTSKGAHGTHVMDIAAGSGGGSGVSGFAPDSTIIFVDASTSDINWSGTQVVGSSFGDSVQLLEAVKFIFDRAGARPCVINISLGTNGGPHDGTTLVERGIDQLVQERPNRAVVIAASNSYGDHIHAAGRLTAGNSVDLTWNRPPSSGWQDELEVWYSDRDRITAEIILPDGTSAGTIDPGRTGRAEDNGRVVLLVANRLADPNNGDNMIGIFVDDSLPPGIWTLRLTATEVHDTGAFHAWIERDDSSQASFQSNIDDDFTIGSISCGQSSIVVGSYDAHKPTTPLSWFSSAGPTRDGRQKPELSAPGHAVVAAHSRTRTGVIPKSGTSMAAPAVTGSLALLFGEARSRGVNLDIGRTKALLTQSVRKPPGGQWDRRWGLGKLDVTALLNALPGAGAPPTAAASKPKKPSRAKAAKPVRAAPRKAPRGKANAKPKTLARARTKKSAK